MYFQKQMDFWLTTHFLDLYMFKTVHYYKLERSHRFPITTTSIKQLIE
jgi:ABC-type uncharacterized transport system fused permease/ATPase subunit